MPDNLQPPAAPAAAPSFAVDDGTGEVYTVQPGHQGEAELKGLRPIDANEANAAIQQRRYGTAQQQLLGAPEQYISGATGGLSEVLEKKLGVNPAGIIGRQQANPVENFLAQGLGMGTSFAAGGELLDALGVGAKTAEGVQAGKSLATATARGALQQGLWGGAREYSDQVLANEPVNGEAIVEAAGINGLLGAGAEAGIFGLGKAAEHVGLTNLTNKAGLLSKSLYDKAASFATGEPVENIAELTTRAEEALKDGGFAKTFEKDFQEAAGEHADVLTELETQGRAAATDAREQLLQDLKARFSGAGDAQKTAAQELFSGMRSDIDKFTAENPANELFGKSSVKVPSLEDFEEQVAQQTGLGKLSAEERAARPGWTEFVKDSHQDALHQALAAGTHGTKVLGALDIAEQKLQQATTGEEVWHIVDKVMHNLDDAIPDTAEELKRTKYEAGQLAQDLRTRASEFTKSEDLFPEFGNKWRTWQDAHSNFLGAFGNLQKAAKSVEGGEYVNSKQKIANLLKKIHLDPERSSAIVDNAMDSAQKLAAAHDVLGPLLKPNDHVPRIPGITAQLEKLEAARLKAVRSLAMKELAARTGGGGPGGLGYMRPGFAGLIASKALGIPYLAAGIPILGYKMATEPAATAITKARLVGMVSRLFAKVNTGAAKSIASLVAGAAKKGAVGESLQQLARKHMETDPITNKLYRDWQDGTQAHSDFVNSPGDVAGRLQQSLGQLEPSQQQTASLALGNHLAYLQSVAPKSTNIGTLDSVPPPKSALDKYAKIAYAVQHPVEVLNQQVASGNVDQETIAAIEATSPLILQKYRTEATKAFSDQWQKMGKISLAAQRGYAKLVNSDLDSGQVGHQIELLSTPANFSQPLPNLGSRPNKTKISFKDSTRLPYERQAD